MKNMTLAFALLILGASAWFIFQPKTRMRHAHHQNPAAFNETNKAAKEASAKVAPGDAASAARAPDQKMLLPNTPYIGADSTNTSGIGPQTQASAFKAAGAAFDRSNPIAQNPSISELKTQMQKLSSAQLNSLSKKLSKEIESKRFIERANASKLSDSEIRDFDQLIAKKATAQVILIERNISEIQGKKL